MLHAGQLTKPTSSGSVTGGEGQQANWLKWQSEQQEGEKPWREAFAGTRQLLSQTCIGSVYSTWMDVESETIIFTPLFYEAFLALHSL